jgi:hypothetical protein
MALDFEPAYWDAIARFGTQQFADAVERYLRMQRADYDRLRSYATRYFSGRDLATITACIDAIQVEHDPLLQTGAQLGAVITITGQGNYQTSGNQLLEVSSTPVDPPTEPPPSVVSAAEPAPRPQTHVKFEIDLGRICDTRNELRQWRLWVYGHEAGDGSGKLEKATFFAFLSCLGIVNSKRTFDDILAGGAGLYWTFGYHRNPEGVESLYIHFTGQKRLNSRITDLELKKAPVKGEIDAPCQQPITMRPIDTNRPGSCYVWADLSDSLADVRSTLYAAWMAVKASHNGSIDISRRVLTALWHRPRKTLIEWEKRADIEVQPVYCEHHNPNDPLVPSYAYPALDVHGNEIATWRASNRYIPKPVDIHQHGGQRRKVRKSVNAIIEAAEPAIENGGGLRPGRLNFDHDRISSKCVEVRDDGTKRYAPVTTHAHKLLGKHIEKQHPDGVPHRHTLYTGFRHGVHIREMSIGTRYRDINMRRDLHTEMTPDFQQHFSDYRRGWVDRYR